MARELRRRDQLVEYVPLQVVSNLFTLRNYKNNVKKLVVHHHHPIVWDCS